MYYEGNNELYHHGIKGMKWGIRRFQNEDGTLTDLGKKRYAMADERLTNRTNWLDKRVAKVAARPTSFSRADEAGKVAKTASDAKLAIKTLKSNQSAMVSLGRRTMTYKIADIAGTSVAAATFLAAGLTSPGLGFLSVGAIPVAAAGGYLYKTLSR